MRASEKRRCVFLIAGCGYLVPSLFGQATKATLTARELFYAADAAAPAPAASAKSAKSASTTRPKAPRQSTPTSPSISEPVASAPKATSPDRTPLINASYGASAAPLGLRYSILKRQEGNQTTEVDADTVFHAGDRIRLDVEANTDGYLYVVNRGSSGTWKILFPAQEVHGGDNRIHKRTKYEIPAGYTFTFDEQAGSEKLFIVFSRDPEPNLESLIYSLGRPVATTPEATPPGKSEPPRLLLASAAVSDDTIGKLRNTYARDLIIEKMTDEHPGEKKEKAVYAVNPSKSSDSRVVADVTLKHQ